VERAIVKKPSQAAKEWLAAIGAEGGKKGGKAKGKRKARSPEHYRRMVEARKAKRGDRE
jgi:hypothetical protein